MVFLVFAFLLLILGHDFKENFRILSSFINTASVETGLVNSGQIKSYDDGSKINPKSDACKTLHRSKNTIQWSALMS